MRDFSVMVDLKQFLPQGDAVTGWCVWKTLFSVNFTPNISAFVGLVVLAFELGAQMQTASPVIVFICRICQCLL